MTATADVCLFLFVVIYRHALKFYSSLVIIGRKAGVTGWGKALLVNRQLYNPSVGNRGELRSLHNVRIIHVEVTHAGRGEMVLHTCTLDKASLGSEYARKAIS